jgi:hypothetical protein
MKALKSETQRLFSGQRKDVPNLELLGQEQPVDFVRVHVVTERRAPRTSRCRNRVSIRKKLIILIKSLDLETLKNNLQ